MQSLLRIAAVCDEAVLSTHSNKSVQMSARSYGLLLKLVVTPYIEAHSYITVEFTFIMRHVTSISTTQAVRATLTLVDQV